MLHSYISLCVPNIVRGWLRVDKVTVYFHVFLILYHKVTDKSRALVLG